MKKYFLLTMAIAALVSCNKAQDESNTQGENQGSITFSAQLNTEVSESSTTKADDVQDVAKFELDESLVPSVNDLKLTLTGTYLDHEDNVTKDFLSEYEKFEQYDAAYTYLEEGNYKAAFSIGDQTEESEKNACFYGEKEFTIIARKMISEEVDVKLSNSAIRIKTSEWFNKYYTSATFVVTTDLGNEFIFTFSDTSVEPETDKIIFVNPEATLTLKGSAMKSNGYAVTFDSADIGTVTKGALNTISIDASQAAGLELTVKVDQTITKLPEQYIELNPDVDDGDYDYGDKN